MHFGSPASRLASWPSSCDQDIAMRAPSRNWPPAVRFRASVSTNSRSYARVVHVSPVMFGDDGHWGGGERYPVELARAQSEFVPIRLVSFAKHGRRERFGQLELVVLPIQARYGGNHLNPISGDLFRELHDVPVVHVHQVQTMLTDVLLLRGGLTGQRPFVTDHGGTAHNMGRLFPRTRLIEQLLAVSRYSASFFPGLDSRTTVIYGGADLDRFQPAPGPRRGVVFVGRLLPHKGVDVLIDAADPEMEVTIYGRAYNGPYRETLGRLAAGKNVRFVDDATDAEIVCALQTARVLVLPSVFRSQYGPSSLKAELFGLVLVEAMACATPVISSDAGPLPEVVVNGETGFVVPAGDPHALRCRLREILEDDPLWADMSIRAFDRARERFSWRAVAQRTLAAYSESGRTV